MTKYLARSLTELTKKKILNEMKILELKKKSMIFKFNFTLINPYRFTCLENFSSQIEKKKWKIAALRLLTCYSL